MGSPSESTLGLEPLIALSRIFCATRQTKACYNIFFFSSTRSRPSRCSAQVFYPSSSPDYSASRNGMVCHAGSKITPSFHAQKYRRRRCQRGEFQISFYPRYTSTVLQVNSLLGHKICGGRAKSRLNQVEAMAYVPACNLYLATNDFLSCAIFSACAAINCRFS